MDITNMLYSDGYVGSMGVSWKPVTEASLEAAIVGAMEIESMTREQVVETLSAGKSLRWTKSPNFYYDHSYGKIGTKRKPVVVTTVKCDCGHEVPESQVMSASLGTACPDCYDRMSDS